MYSCFGIIPEDIFILRGIPRNPWTVQVKQADDVSLQTGLRNNTTRITSTLTKLWRVELKLPLMGTKETLTEKNRGISEDTEEV